MARNEYKGKRVGITLDEDIYELLIKEAAQNGLSISARIKQLLIIRANEFKAGIPDQQRNIVPVEDKNSFQEQNKGNGINTSGFQI